MAKHYRSVSEMAKDIIDDKIFVDRLDQHIAARVLAKTLFSLRCSQGITQKAMAKRLGCTQGRVSKLENSTVEGIKVGDLLAYAKVLALDLSFDFRKNSELVRHIEFPSVQDAGVSGVKEVFAEALAQHRLGDDFFRNLISATGMKEVPQLALRLQSVPSSGTLGPRGPVSLDLEFVRFWQ